MKLKSSNKKTYLFLGGLLICVVFLFAFKEIYTKKPTKYPLPPLVEKKTELDLIQISLNENSYLKLKKKRDKAVSVGLLETNDNDYVPATITFQDENYRAEIRLKGDWTDHLKDDKWSFRIKLKDDKTIMGMRKFSVHRPSARGFINEWLYHKAIKEAGIMGLRYGFLEGMIHIKKNNSSKYITKEVGMYAIEESFDKRTIESNARKESIILKFSENAYWAKVKSNKAIGDPSGIIWHSFMDFQVDYPITVFGEDKVLQDQTMRNYFKLSKGLLGDLRFGIKTIDQVFDVKELAMQNAILNLFGATHGLPLINVRYYYNPITSKLEPIAFDGNSGHLLDEYKHVAFLNSHKDSVYLKELAYALEKVSQPAYLNNLVQTHKDPLSHYKKELKKEYRWELLRINNLKQNQIILRKELARLKKRYKLEDIDLTLIPIEIKSLGQLTVPKPKFWQKKNVSFKKEKNKKERVFKIERSNTKKSSYILVDSLKIDNMATYMVSMLVKKGDKGNAFGLRVQGNFPNRTDALFNLEEGKLKGIKNVGGFSNDGATIEKKEDWFKITLKVRPNTDYIKLVFGPTDFDKPIVRWVTPTPNKPNIYIDISSIKVVEVE